MFLKVLNFLLIRTNRISLFVLIFCNPYFLEANELFIKRALEDKLYNSKEWKALLHIRNEKPQIFSKSFLFSFDNFSLENELILTINSFKEQSNICKFPARYLYLSENIKDFKSTYSNGKCSDFNIYLQKTNLESIDLIFASENVKNPSSMMGHVFFNLKSKKDENNKIKQNSVSFFTMIDTLNIPFLIYESTIKGMKGYFVLSPYKEQIFNYINNEERSIWEYKLSLTDFQKKLIYYHFWELKDIDLTYYFTGFNCATMIDDILSMTNENYMDENSFWVTPKDVIKNANRNNLIENTNMIPSIEWKINMLVENIDTNILNEILHLFKIKNFTSLNSFNYSNDLNQKNLEKEFILTYTKFSYYNKNSISKKDYEYILNLVKHTDEFVIDIKKYKNPLKTFDDSQVSLAYLRNNEKNSLELSFLGASNTIFDDNREYFSESSLKIGEINLLINEKSIHINSINFYNMKSLVPWNHVTKELSKEFKFNYEKHYNKNLEKINVLNISGGIGISYKIHNDILIYGMEKLGIGVNFKEIYPYSSFETGIIIYEILNMKTVLSHEFIYNQDNSNNMYQNLNINQSIFIDKEIRTDISFNKNFDKNISNDTVMLRVNYYF